MAKPGGSLILDTGHALVRNPLVCLAFNEGSGITRDLAKPTQYIENYLPGGPTWGSNADGACGVIAADKRGLVLGYEGTQIPTSAYHLTAVYVRRKTDLTLYAGPQFGNEGLGDVGTWVHGAKNCFDAFIPAADGNVYWDFGGAPGNFITGDTVRIAPWRLTWSGYTPSTDLEYWVFVAGTAGSAIYLNGTQVAVQTTPLRRADMTLNTLGEVTRSERIYLGLGAYGQSTPSNPGAAYPVPHGIDRCEISFFMLLDTEWSAAEVAAWTASPYAVLLSGTPAPLTTATIAPTLPTANVSAIPADALGGTQRTITALDNFQTELSKMGNGDTTLVESGARWIGNFTAPNKPAGGWSALRPTNEAALSAPGTRINPANAAQLAALWKLRTPNQSPTFTVNDRSDGWRVIGAELDTAATDYYGGWIYGVMGLGWNTHDANGGRWTAADHAERLSHIIIDRVYAHGTLTSNLTRGFFLQCRDLRITDSVINEIHATGQEAAALLFGAADGPGLIQNNEISGAGQCIFLGGSNIPRIDEMTRDLKILRNWLYKKREWDPLAATHYPGSGIVAQGVPWTMKPIIETKFGERLLIEGNTLDDSFLWPAYTIDTFKQYPADVGAQVYLADVTYRYNVHHRGTAMFQVWPGLAPMYRIHVHDNLLIGPLVTPGGSSYAAQQFFYLTGTGTEFWQDLWIEHNTVVTNEPEAAVIFDGVAPTSMPARRLRCKNNIWGYGGAGFIAAGIWSADPGLFLHTYPGMDLTHNAMCKYAPFTDALPSTQAYWTGLWGAGTFFLPGDAAAALIDPATGQLLPGSPLKAGGASQASDGTDNGIDFAALAAAQIGIQAQFTWQQVTGTFTVNFAGSIAGATASAYAWDFGDTATSASQNPSHTFLAFRSYTVTLTVTAGGVDYVTAQLVTLVAPGVPPTITITTPTAAATFATSAASVSIGGTASDDTAVSSVTWVNDRGGSGTATGTTAWSAIVPLLSGANVLTVTATDPEGNHGTDVLTVTYTPEVAPALRRTRLGATSRTTL